MFSVFPRKRKYVRKNVRNLLTIESMFGIMQTNVRNICLHIMKSYVILEG